MNFTMQEYLHFYCDPSLCHGDIKSSNVLLASNFLAKVLHSGKQLSYSNISILLFNNNVVINP